MGVTGKHPTLLIFINFAISSIHAVHAGFNKQFIFDTYFEIN